MLHYGLDEFSKNTFFEMNLIKGVESFDIFNGGKWYVGLTEDPKHSFLGVHGLDLLKKERILSEECSFKIAEFIKAFLISMGFRNDSGKDILNGSRRIDVYVFRD